MSQWQLFNSPEWTTGRFYQVGSTAVAGDICIKSSSSYLMKLQKFQVL